MGYDVKLSRQALRKRGTPRTRMEKYSQSVEHPLWTFRPSAPCASVRKGVLRTPAARARPENTSLLLIAACPLLLLALTILIALAGCGAAAASVNVAATATENTFVAQQVDTLGRQSAASFSQQVQTTYDPAQRDATVTVTVGWTNDIHAADVAKEQERVKAICFAVQQALWTANLPLHQLTATVLGPVTTGYTQQDNDAHGAARVTAPTAAKLKWASLTPDTAWNLYDESYLRTDYDPPVVALPGGALA